MTLAQQIRSNRRKSVFLFLGFFLIYALLGYASYVFLGDGGPVLIAIVTVVMILTALFWGDDMAVAVAGGKEITERRESPALYDALETLAIGAGIRMPRLFVSPDPSPNAFAAGRNEKQAIVCVNQGLLDRLDKQELEGVLAHEISHVRNEDVKLMTYVAVLAGSIAMLSWVISRMFLFSDNRGGNPIVLVAVLLGVLLAPLAAVIVQMSISRRREFLADAAAADLTRYPQGLASALEKISALTPAEEGAGSKGNPATAHMYIAPLALEREGIGSRIFSTHPPTEERVERLLELSGGVRHSGR